ncbi:MAG: hypothetical protein JW779_00005 [Candidatus Thorarchaeota archaeon]|nr:hypothetical protein [Candidatus Thorarchaeota archaeon]
MRESVLCIFLLVVIVFVSTFAAATDMVLNDQNRTVVFRFELTKCIIDGSICDSHNEELSELGIGLDHEISLLEYKIKDEGTQSGLYLDFEIRSFSADLFAVTGSIQISVINSGISQSVETMILPFESLHLAPLFGIITSESLLGDHYLIDFNSSDFSQEIIIVLSFRLLGKDNDVDISFVFEKEPHEVVELKDGFSYRLFHGSHRSSVYNSVYIFLNDLIVFYRDGIRLFSHEDFFIENVGEAEDIPEKGMATLFVNSCGGRASGMLWLLTYHDDEIIRLQRLLLDSYSSWEFLDVDNNGIVELVVPHLGVAYSTCSADNPWYERLAVWRDNRWISDSFGEFPEYYAKKYMELEREIAKSSVVDDKLLVYYVYYMLMSGLSAGETTTALEEFVNEHRLVVRDAYHNSREWTIDSNFVQDVLEEAMKFSIEKWN